MSTRFTVLKALYDGRSVRLSLADAALGGPSAVLKLLRAGMLEQDDDDLDAVSVRATQDFKNQIDAEVRCGGGPLKQDEEDACTVHQIVQHPGARNIFPAARRKDPDA